MKYNIFYTPFNLILGYVWSDKGLREMSFYLDEECFQSHLKKYYKESVNERLVTLEEMLEKYFQRESVILDYNLDISGTVFQMNVWNIVREIPYGQVKSYKWVAWRVGNPRSSRAVGNALSSNPVVLIIPCHRVIKNDGSLGRYGALDWLKKRLLELEGVKIYGDRVEKRMNKLSWFI
ncbi:MAG: methylated-DNA--[protein]-cysteine S-methyltransferase [Nitrososphaeria archaeon]|nr:methylated-DNA--[protein]-cysteine S-methyltransferase [Nitrososphaeria archaeon]